MSYTERVLVAIKEKDSNQPEFIQAVSEVLHAVEPVLLRHPEYEKNAILERISEAERIIQFKVPWRADDGQIFVNRGYRVQFNGALGPYKGGLRFNPSVNLGVLKFLGFEQMFKNALTTLPIGGGKGGSDFDPKGKSEEEICRFCCNFINELHKYIGPDIDVPAGDMGVGSKEIGYMYGHYRRLTGKNEPGAFTGKAISHGGSYVRTEATGYGLIYFLQAMAKVNDIDLNNKPTIISGCGNVALYALEKAQQIGLSVVAISDSQGYLVAEKLNLELLKKIKETQKLSLAEYIKEDTSAKYFNGSVYDSNIKAEIILPCAKENEINGQQAEQLVKNGAIIVAEGANMPANRQAVECFLDNDILFAPGKAANAGGVATSALEMSQNSMRLRWSFTEVDNRLKDIMLNIHDQLLQTIKEYDLSKHDYPKAANIAAFEKVAEAMIAQGFY